MDPEFVCYLLNRICRHLNPLSGCTLLHNIVQNSREVVKPM
jgi:hypothetical protein